MDDCINCSNLCDAQIQTETTVTLSRDLAAGDTEIFLVPNTVIPSVGYGLFNGCFSTAPLVEQYVPPAPCGCRPNVTLVQPSVVEDKYEIIKYCGTRVEESGEVVLINLTRGLPFRGCDDTVSIPSFIKDHVAGETIKIGTPQIHYYWCKLCSCLSEVRNAPIETLEEKISIMIDAPTVDVASGRYRAFVGVSPDLDGATITNAEAYVFSETLFAPGEEGGYTFIHVNNHTLGDTPIFDTQPDIVDGQTHSVPIDVGTANNIVSANDTISIDVLVTNQGAPKGLFIKLTFTRP